MASGFYNVPKAVNEPVKSYAPGSPERRLLLDTYRKMYNEKVDIPFYIGGKEVKCMTKFVKKCSHLLKG